MNTVRPNRKSLLSWWHLVVKTWNYILDSGAVWEVGSMHFTVFSRCAVSLILFPQTLIYLYTVIFYSIVWYKHPCPAVLHQARNTLNEPFLFVFTSFLKSGVGDIRHWSSYVAMDKAKEEPEMWQLFSFVYDARVLQNKSRLKRLSDVPPLTTACSPLQGSSTATRI